MATSEISTSRDYNSEAFAQIVKQKATIEQVAQVLGLTPESIFGALVEEGRSKNTGVKVLHFRVETTNA